MLRELYRGPATILPYSNKGTEYSDSLVDEYDVLVEELGEKDQQVHGFRPKVFHA